MNIPTPAAFKKTLDEKRASETIQQEVSEKSRRSTSSIRKTTTGSSVSQTESGSTSRTPRKKSSTKISANGKNVSEKKQDSSLGDSGTTENSQPKTSPKKPFVLKEHLTQRPLVRHDGLTALKTSLERSAKRKNGTGSRAPHTVPQKARTTKQSNKNTKENN